MRRNSSATCPAPALEGFLRLPDRRSSALAGRRHIEFLGRLDGQVKLRGFRIKPGEIEDALRKFPEVDDAVVILDSQRNIPRLIGYVVSFGVAPEACDLRAHLKARLPEYMAPAAFAVLREWSLTSSGKIDRRASAPGMGATCRYSSKPAHLERNIADLWKEVMSLQQLGLTTISLTWAVIL